MLVFEWEGFGLESFQNYTSQSLHTHTYIWIDEILKNKRQRAIMINYDAQLLHMGVLTRVRYMSPHTLLEHASNVVSDMDESC